MPTCSCRIVVVKIASGGEISRLIKMLTSDNVKDMARNLGKSSHGHPLLFADKVLTQLERCFMNASESVPLIISQKRFHPSILCSLLQGRSSTRLPLYCVYLWRERRPLFHTTIHMQFFRGHWGGRSDMLLVSVFCVGFAFAFVVAFNFVFCYCFCLCCCFYCSWFLLLLSSFLLLLSSCCYIAVVVFAVVLLLLLVLLLCCCQCLCCCCCLKLENCDF